MNKEVILSMKAGNQLDVLVRKEIFGEVMEECPTCGKYHARTYSTDISAAWQVVEKMKECLFSVRLSFLVFLEAQTAHEVPGTGEKVTIAWPDVFWHITPETICKAALIAKNRDEVQKALNPIERMGIGE